MGAFRAARRSSRAAGRVPLHKAVIGLVDLTVPERLLEHAVATFALRDDHKSCRVGIKPVHDALALGGTACGDLTPGGEEALEHGRAGPARGRMGGDARRLVHHEDVGILVDDDKAGNGLGAVRRKAGLAAGAK